MLAVTIHTGIQVIPGKRIVRFRDSAEPARPGDATDSYREQWQKAVATIRLVGLDGLTPWSGANAFSWLAEPLSG